MFSTGDMQPVVWPFWDLLLLVVLQLIAETLVAVPGQKNAYQVVGWDWPAEYFPLFVTSIFTAGQDISFMAILGDMDVIVWLVQTTDEKPY